MLTELFFVIYLKVYPTFAYMAYNIDANLFIKNVQLLWPHASILSKKSDTM